MAPIEVPDDVVTLLAGAIRTSIRELEGAFNKLVAYAQLVDRAITVDLAQTMLAEVLRASTRRITIDEIQKTCVAPLPHRRIGNASRSAALARWPARARSPCISPRN